MPENYKDYLDQFGREVEETMRQSASPPGTDPLPALHKALSDFESWWDREAPSSCEPEPDDRVESLRRDLERSQAEVQGMKASLSRPAEPDAQESRRKCERLEQENEDLKRCLLSVQSQIADAQTRALRAQEGYESTILRLEEQSRIHAERLLELARDKQFLESQLSRASDRSRDLEAALEKQRTQNQALEREVVEARGRADGLDRSLTELQRDHSAQEGSLRELRVHAAAFQERLLRSRATLNEDSERGREIQRQGEELRRSLSAQEDASRKLGEELRQGMAQGRAESDVRMRETVRFLEEQLHRVEEDSSSRYEEFRGLLETLARVLPQQDEEDAG
ncbi:MAG: hypothetical protein WCU88_12355 [Elusimicrobiota bacterium]|jgi:chromosome segregation ATPase